MLGFLAQFAAEDDIISDFISQLPTSLFVFVCGSGLLLLVAFAWFAYFKPLRNIRRKQAAERATSAPKPTPPPSKPKPKVAPQSAPQSAPQPAPITSPQPATAESAIYDDDDMPDLDMLLATETEDDAPQSAPQSAPITSPTPQPDQPPPARGNSRTYRVQLDSGDIVRAEEMAAILRDPRDGRLIVQLDQTAYRTLVNDEDAKARFVELMRELSDVVTKPDDNPPEPEELPQIPREFVPGALPSYRMEDHVQITKKGTYEVGPVPELNLAEAIEMYLQHKIRQTPEYAGRQIHVHPAPGGVRIQVDNQYYEAVGDVEDADVRLFIQQTIKEWQSQQS